MHSKDAKILQNALGSIETDSTLIADVPQVRDQSCQFHVGYELNPSCCTRADIDIVLTGGSDTGHALYDAIRTAAWAGGCDRTRTTTYSDRTVDFISDEDWQFVTDSRVHSARKEIFRIPVNLSCYPNHDVWKQYPCLFSTPAPTDDLRVAWSNILAEMLSSAPRQQRYDRVSLTDDEVRSFILEGFHGDQTVTRSRLLRHLRDSGYRCEEKRFKSLFERLLTELD
jgi:hypothetical protein